MKWFLSVLFLMFATAANAQDGTLILAVDMSDSIDQEELDLQMKGYAQALRHFPYLNNIHVEVVTFDTYSKIVSTGSVQSAVRWFTEFDIETFSKQSPEYRQERGQTCVHKALRLINNNFALYPQPVIIDISLDGAENCDMDEALRLADVLEQKGAIINVIIVGKHYTLDDTKQFADKIKTGKIFIAETFYELEDTLYQKLQTEVAMLKK